MAVVVGQGANHIASISELRCNADFTAEAYASNFTQLDPLPGVPPCFEPSVCPRSLYFWQDQCAADPFQLQLIAQDADAQSAYFDWGASAAEMCSTLQSPGTEMRFEAERQFAALLANVMAARYGVHDTNGDPIILSPLTPANCPGVTGATVADLVRTGRRGSSLSAVEYGDGNQTNPRALFGVDLGLPFFGGGAGLASEFLGSSLDPATHPDSFATVEIRFSTIPQKAYRYLRHERASDGAASPLGRRYEYGGFHDVPFQVWDVDRNVQLDAAFVERVNTDDDGNVLPPMAQPWSLDFTWGPDATENGGREYLVVFRSAYTGTPDPMFEVDGALIEGGLPGLYGLASRLLYRRRDHRSR